MSDGINKEPEGKQSASSTDEFNNPDFQYVLKALLAAYQPVLEQELNRAKDAAGLEKEAQARPPSCEDEIRLGVDIFGKFLTQDVATRMLPAEARTRLGPVDSWQWCLRHLQCCVIFGWLVCRGPRTFRAYSYYLYRYWICVREALGDPVSTPPTSEQRQDFHNLVDALANAFRPYLTDQLASVEFPSGIPDEVIDGKINCLEGLDQTCEIFERLLTPATAQSLLGAATFGTHSQEPSFWFCRCWCICAICFGCCLARARSFIDVVWCLVYLFQCLRDCFQPLVCEITKPTAGECAEEQYFPGPNVLGVEIVGTAVGAFCDHYTLEWKPAGASDTFYTQMGIVYAAPAPPGGPGACGKVNATLGYLSTTMVPVPDDVTVRLCVYAVAGSGTLPCCKTVSFEIFRVRVWISGIHGVRVEDPPGVLNPTAQLKTPNVPAGVVRSFGTCLDITGRAWVGKCTNRQIKRYTLSYQPGFVVGTGGPWTQFWQVDYLTPLQQKEIQTNDFDLTSSWIFEPIFLGMPPCATPSPPDCGIPKDWLVNNCWQSGRYLPDVPVAPQSFPVDPQAGPTWTSQQLPPINCQSGKYTLLLDVEDTLTNHYYDTQWVWFDNKEIHGKISQVAGVPPCSPINLSTFAAPNADCTKPWPADLLGIAYDEFIIEGDTSIPSDNYAMVAGVVQGGYELWIKKDGAPDPGHQLPIPGPGAPPWLAGPFQGVDRVGDPGTVAGPDLRPKCTTASPPPMPSTETTGMLAQLDLRRLDAVCNPGEPDLTLQRGSKGKPGECCGYVLTLLVFDNSVCPLGPDGRHEIEHHFPICICNDLPPVSG